MNTSTSKTTTSTFPMSYYTVQGTSQPFITGPYQPTQYKYQQQQILPQVFHFIPGYFPVITMTLSFHALTGKSKQFCPLNTSYVSMPLALDEDIYQKTHIKKIEKKKTFALHSRIEKTSKT